VSSFDFGPSQTSAVLRATRCSYNTLQHTATVSYIERRYRMAKIHRMPIFKSHFLPKSPINSGSFAKRDLQHKASCASSPPCTSGNGVGSRKVRHAPHCNEMQHTVTKYSTQQLNLQHTATHCNTLQHTATHSQTNGRCRQHLHQRSKTAPCFTRSSLLLPHASLPPQV